MSESAQPTAAKPNKPTWTRQVLSWPVLSGTALGVVLLIAFALPIMVLLIVGMLPTVAALLVDRSGGLRSTRCVAAANFAGVLPIIAMVLRDGNSMAALSDLMSQGHVWLIMYGAAACGWGLLRAGPAVAGAVVARLVQREIATIKRDQSKLVNDWGRKILDE